MRFGTALLYVLAAGCSRAPAIAPASSPAPTPSAAYSGPPPRVVVVGGGLAGLVAAYELQKRGITSHVLEASDTFGGRVATAEYGDGLTAEFGLQELWADNPLVGIARELKVPLDEGAEPPWSSQVIDGKLFPYVQDTPQEFFRTLVASDAEAKQLDDWLAKTTALHHAAKKEGLKNAEVRKLQDISFKTWLERSKLPPNAETLIRHTIECELGTDWNGFSAAVGVLEYGVFLEGLNNFHIQGGNSRLIDALASAVKGPKTTSALVTKVERGTDASGKTSVTVTWMKDHKVQTIRAERVVLAVPFWRLHQIRIEPPLSEDVWDAVITLQRGQYTVVHLLVPKDARKLWEIDGVSPLTALSNGPLGVIYGVQERSETSKLDVFSLLIYGQQAAAWHMVPREIKLAEVRQELDKLWPGLSAQIQDAYVYTYHPASLPVWPPGRSPIDAQADLLRKPNAGLHLAGDYLYNAHSDGAARSGIAAAEQIAAELAP